jgi:uncharacterized protein
MNAIRVVLDTDILVPAIPRKSPLHWIFQQMLNEAYVLCVTTEILNEYAEILERFYGHNTASSVMNTLTYIPSLHRVDVYYRWNLIPQDADDNKFVDCAIACNAKYLVSHDKHFQPLRGIAFPQVEVIDAKAFKSILES